MIYFIEFKYLILLFPFRFDHFGLQQLVVHLQIPPVIIVPGHRDRVSQVEVICILLDRMAYPRKWSDLACRYNRHASALSRIFKYAMHKIIQGGMKILTAATSCLTEERLQSYARAFWQKGVPTNLLIWSVIDVKKVKICRPSIGQRAQYSGHKKIHCFKFQTLQAPDGIIVHCSYSSDGRRGDGFILRESNLLNWARARQELFVGYCCHSEEELQLKQIAGILHFWRFSISC